MGESHEHATGAELERGPWTLTGEVDLLAVRHYFFLIM